MTIPTKAEIEKAKELMSKMPAFAFPSDMKNWVERHMAQALADARERTERDAEELVGSLERCIKWMRPVIDGFGIPKDAEVRAHVLDVAKAALAAWRERHPK